MREQLYRQARKKLQDTLDVNKENLGEDFALLVGEGITYTGETIEMTSPYKFGDSATEVSLA